MVIYALLSLVSSYFTYTRNSNQLGVWVREVGGNLLSQIAKMADRLFADRVVLPVTAAIYEVKC